MIRRVSKRNCAAVESLLTFCPPGPEARTKEISMSFSSIVRSREIRSMASPNRKGPKVIPGGNRAESRIAVLCGVCVAVSSFVPSPALRGRARGQTVQAATADAHWRPPLQLSSRKRGEGSNVPCGGRSNAEGSVRRGRGRSRGLCGGLRGAADDHGEKTMAPQPLGGLPWRHRASRRRRWRCASR